MRIGEIERVGEGEIPAPALTPLPPPEPAAPQPPAPAPERVAPDDLAGAYVAIETKNMEVGPPPIDPKERAHMPLSAVAHWIASEGGAISITADEKRWRPVFEKLLAAIVSDRRLAVVGRRNGLPEIIPNVVFVGISVAYPCSPFSAPVDRRQAVSGMSAFHWRGRLGGNRRRQTVPIGTARARGMDTPAGVVVRRRSVVAVQVWEGGT